MTEGLAPSATLAHRRASVAIAECLQIALDLGRGGVQLEGVVVTAAGQPSPYQSGRLAEEWVNDPQACQPATHRRLGRIDAMLLQAADNDALERTASEPCRSTRRKGRGQSRPAPQQVVGPGQQSRICASHAIFRNSSAIFMTVLTASDGSVFSPVCCALVQMPRPCLRHGLRVSQVSSSVLIKRRRQSRVCLALCHSCPTSTRGRPVENSRPKKPSLHSASTAKRHSPGMILALSSAVSPSSLATAYASSR